MDQVNDKRPCRNCSESIVVTKERAEEILQWFITKRNRQTVDDETASARLAQCRSCEAYHAAADTCQYCGCLAAVKTRLEGERCPHPAEPKW